LSIGQTHTKSIYFFIKDLSQLFDLEGVTSVMLDFISLFFEFQTKQYVLIFNAKLQLLK